MDGNLLKRISDKDLEFSEEELKMLADEIESIRQTHVSLSHALDLFATMYASECPLIERIRQFNEGV